MSVKTFTAGRTANITVGGITIHLFVERIRLGERIREKYGEFLSERVPELTLQISLTDKTNPVSTAAGFKIQSSREKFEVITPDSALSLDRLHGQGTLFTRKHTAETEVELVLRILFAFLATQNHGFLFHGAGIVHNGTGCLFFGPSGAGKTTVARLSAPDLLLNDDLVMIKRDSTGWIMHATPFSNPNQAPPSVISSRVEAVFRLAQDEQVFIEPIGPAEALAEVIASIPILPAEQGFTDQLLQSAGDFIQNVPVYRLHFLPDRSFWKIIEVDVIN